jgi:hypothetical protein
MLKIELLHDRKVVILRPDGLLASTDFEQLAKTIDPIIASFGKLTGVLIRARSFPGWATFGAMFSHLKFIAGHHRQIERIGVVTDSGALKVLSHSASCFVKPDIKIFSAGAEDRAMVWLQTGIDQLPAE